jgi:integrase
VLTSQPSGWSLLNNMSHDPALVMNNVNLKTVQHLLGHKDIRMTLRYSHLSREHLQAAVGTLDRKAEVGTKREHAENA